MAMLAVSMSQKSACDKFLGERFCVRAGTLGDAAPPVIGVSTLGSNRVLLVFCMDWDLGPGLILMLHGGSQNWLYQSCLSFVFGGLERGMSQLWRFWFLKLVFEVFCQMC
jgi:hypothetical protein